MLLLVLVLRVRISTKSVGAWGVATSLVGFLRTSLASWEPIGMLTSPFRCSAAEITFEHGAPHQLRINNRENTVLDRTGRVQKQHLDAKKTVGADVLRLEPSQPCVTLSPIQVKSDL